MDWQETPEIECPYCGEILTLMIDYSISQQSYVEDCHVCCRPILIDVRIHSLDDIEIGARPENE